MKEAQELHRYRYEIEDALSLGMSLTFHELPPLIQSGQLRLYSNDGGLLLVEPNRMQIGSVWCICVAAGELDSCVALLGEVERDARAAGATYLTIVGRVGWIKVARPHGFRPEAVTLVKDIN